MQQAITCLMFTGAQCGKAEEAANLYVSLLPGSRILNIERHGAGGGGPEGSVKWAAFTIAGNEYAAMDSSGPHAFTFTPATSIVIGCTTEAEIDATHAKLSEGGTALMPLGTYPFARKFAWLNDRFGVSWQLMLK